MNTTLRVISLGLALSCVQGRLQGAPNPYRELLPSAAETADSGKVSDIRITVNDLLRKSKHELDSCIAIANVKEKAYISRTQPVEARSKSIVLRVRKNIAAPAHIFLETSATDQNLIGTCLQKALRTVVATDILQGETLDGRVVADAICSLEVDRQRFSLDEIDFRCTANWRYFRIDDAYSETSTKTWK